jgi:hypothetical protein
MIQSRRGELVPNGPINDPVAMRRETIAYLDNALEQCGEMLVPISFWILQDENGYPFYFGQSWRTVGPISDCVVDWLRPQLYPSQTESLRVTIHAACADPVPADAPEEAR